MKQLEILGQNLANSLKLIAANNDKIMLYNNEARKVHVTGAGRTLTFAYEQLRNAAEYADDDLLQYAIKRFYKRVFLTKDHSIIRDGGEELIVELTLAGYLQNDSIVVDNLAKINALAIDYYDVYLNTNNEAWSLDILAYEVERLLIGDYKKEAFCQFSYDYFLSIFDSKKVFSKEIENFEILLFMAVAKGLIRSNRPSIRSQILKRYGQYPGSSAFEYTNKMIDSLIESSEADKLYHLVYRKAAPLRVLWRLIDEDDNFAKVLESRDNFVSVFKSRVESEYRLVNKRINKGVVKSVIFIIITKMILGIALEVPYDHFVHGQILWQPLLINLFFPPLYMIMLRFTLSLPGSNNTRVMVESIDEILYGNNRLLAVSKRTKSNKNTTFNIAYGVFAVLFIGFVSYGLTTLGFGVLHLVIFFSFISAASFLGFRLSRQIREIEVVDSDQNIISTIRDFIYLPFVVIGRWISEKYSKINIVALALDMLIELPLKTILRLVRQWGNFISSKKDEL